VKRLAFAILAIASTASADPTPHSLRMRARSVRVGQAPPDTPPDDAPPAPPPPPPPADTGETEVITVTDTAVDRQLFTGTAPVSVVTHDDLDATGRAMLGDILQALPSQSNAGNPQLNAGGDSTSRINLRGLGASRTLVLLNGRRFVDGGSGADGSIDLNAIPLAVIDRVEVHRDGASALYGADAVGGVVNVITRPRYDGADVSLLTSTSQRGDGMEYDASAVAGFTADDNTSWLVMAADYQRHESVLASARAFSALEDSYDFATKTETRSLSLAGPTTRIAFPACPSGVCKPDGNGGFTDFGRGDLYDAAAESYIYTPSWRFTAFASGGLKRGANTTLFAELLFQTRHSERLLPPYAFDASYAISKDNIYNPFGADLFDVRRRLVEAGNQPYDDTVFTVRGVLGFVGARPKSADWLPGWSYELTLDLGYTQSNIYTSGEIDGVRLADALGPSMLDANGTPICVRTPGDASSQIFYMNIHQLGPDGKPLKIPCVPLNLMSAGPIPKDQLSLLVFKDQSAGVDQQTTLLATTSGRIATLPHHGEITTTIGADVRKELGDVTPFTMVEAGQSANPMSAPTPLNSNYHLFEGFGAVTIVPIVERGFAKRVELDLGARALDYDRFGSSLTYKASGLVRTTYGFGLRTTYSTAYRVPAIFDLFSGRVEQFTNAEDPCDTHPPSGGKTLDPSVQARCTAQGVPLGSVFDTNQQIAAVGGNASLKPETAATASIGVLAEPMPGLALSVDYWHVAIDNAIETLSAQTILANCYDRGIDAFCDAITRDPSTHRITLIDQAIQNVKRTTTSGFDFAVWSDTELAGHGRIHTRLEAQYLLRYDLDTGQQIIHGAGYYDLGVHPRYQASLSSSWRRSLGASAGFALRYVGMYKECAGDDCNDPEKLAMASRAVGSYFKLDLFGSYALPLRFGKGTLQLGVNNVLDTAPPIVYNAPTANSDAATYDFVGRVFYARLSQLF
jgi:outer membrane receptor protein involved in Fe transport